MQYAWKKLTGQKICFTNQNELINKMLFCRFIGSIIFWKFCLIKWTRLQNLWRKLTKTFNSYPCHWARLQLCDRDHRILEWWLPGESWECNWETECIACLLSYRQPIAEITKLISRDVLWNNCYLNNENFIHLQL